MPSAFLYGYWKTAQFNQLQRELEREFDLDFIRNHDLDLHNEFGDLEERYNFTNYGDRAYTNQLLLQKRGEIFDDDQLYMMGITDDYDDDVTVPSYTLIYLFYCNGDAQLIFFKYEEEDCTKIIDYICERAKLVPHNEIFVINTTKDEKELVNINLKDALDIVRTNVINNSDGKTVSFGLTGINSLMTFSELNYEDHLFGIEMSHGKDRSTGGITEEKMIFLIEQLYKKGDFYEILLANYYVEVTIPYIKEIIDMDME